MKVPVFDKRILNQFYSILSAISVLTSIIFLFAKIDDSCKAAIGISVIIILILLYVVIWLYANKRKSNLLENQFFGN